MRSPAANERPEVDAGWRVLFAFQRPWPRATQAELWPVNGMVAGL
jgi:hypothetical protein